MDRQTQFDRLLGLLQANAGRPVAGGVHEGGGKVSAGAVAG